MKNDTIKPSPILKKLLPIDVIPDLRLTQHYRIRKDGSMVYTNGVYAAVTPPDPAYLEVGEQIKAVDGAQAADWIRLPDDAALERVKLSTVFYARRYTEATEEMRKRKAGAEKFPPISESQANKISALEDEIVYYYEKMHEPPPGEMLLDITQLKKLVDWFAGQKKPGKHASKRIVEIAIYRDGGKTQLQMRGVGVKPDGDTPAPGDGYEAWLMGVE